MVKKISENEFQDAIKEGVAVVDFSATWCGPCKMLAPVLEEVSGELTGAKFYAVDVDEANALCNKLGIMSVPSVFVFKDGKKVDLQVGFAGREPLVQMIKNQL